MTELTFDLSRLFDIGQRLKISVDDTLLNIETVEDFADCTRERLTLGFESRCISLDVA